MSGDVDGSTYHEVSARLLGGDAHHTTGDVATSLGIDIDVVRTYWRSLGFADLDDDVAHFTDADVTALGQLLDLVGQEVIGLDTAMTLVRAQAHSADRLSLWQLEALVEDAAARHQLDDISARLVALDRMAVLVPVLEDQVRGSWRRQLAALLRRLDRDVGTAHAPTGGDDERLPLERAVGFIDMISFTERSAGMGPGELAVMVRDFEAGARDVIASLGARVVKTIGDAVLFVADDLGTGAQVALRLVETMAAAGFDVRGSLVWGRLLSRSGDVFGPSVNLASRLGDIAPAGAVVLDDVSAALLQAMSAQVPDVELIEAEPVAVHGLGVVRPVLLGRRTRPGQ